MNQSQAEFVLAFFHEKECTPCRPIVTGYGKRAGCAATHTSLNERQSLLFNNRDQNTQIT